MHDSLQDLEGNIPIGPAMYHGNVANMMHIFYSSPNEDSLQELEGGKPRVASGKQMSAKAARVDTGLDVHTIRYKISKETFLLDPLCITETLRI